MSSAHSTSTSSSVRSALTRCASDSCGISSRTSGSTVATVDASGSAGTHLPRTERQPTGRDVGISVETPRAIASDVSAAETSTSGV
jgi:hypothetical protein